MAQGPISTTWMRWRYTGLPRLHIEPTLGTAEPTA